MKRLSIIGLLIVFSFNINAHRGGQDKNGGHIDKSTGEYHCHKETCDPNYSSSLARSVDTTSSNPDDNGFDGADIELVLSQLRIQPELTETDVSDYGRSKFPHWKDFDADCEDTRAEILRNASFIPPSTDDNNKCMIDDGYWYDPYTDTVFRDDDEMDIDHIVPLKEAYRSGAKLWAKSKREQFANDRENLIAVSLSANRSKSDKDPAKWMPPNSGFHCDYSYAWVFVKLKYDLTIDHKEAAELRKISKNC